MCIFFITVELLPLWFNSHPTIAYSYYVFELQQSLKKMTENGEKNAKKARMEDDPFRWPGYTGEAYPEMCDIRAMPPQPKESELKPGQLPEKLIRQYFEEV